MQLFGPSFCDYPTLFRSFHFSSIGFPALSTLFSSLAYALGKNAMLAGSKTPRRSEL
jgi:hypothetical protein